eukprot:5929272-Pleurochrysis_carterae.AAC.1
MYDRCDAISTPPLDTADMPKAENKYGIAHFANDEVTTILPSKLPRDHAHFANEVTNLLS